MDSPVGSPPSSAPREAESNTWKGFRRGLQNCLLYVFVSCLKLKWRTFTGSSNKSVTGRDINVMSATTVQFSGTPDPLPQVPTSSDFREQHQVQIGSRNSTKNGSTNNLTTETDIDAISVAIPMFFGTSLSLVYMPSSPDASFTQKFQDGGRIPEVHAVITLRRKTISRWSQWLRQWFRARLIYFHRYRHRPTSENSVRYQKSEVLIS